MSKTLPRPQLVKPAPVEADPDSLRPVTAAWLDAIEADFELESHHRRLLVLAGRSWDNACAAREVLVTEGLTYLDRFRQPKVRPEVDIERQAMNTFRLMIRELGLDLPSPDDHRPPRIGG